MVVEPGGACGQLDTPSCPQIHGAYLQKRHYSFAKLSRQNDFDAVEEFRGDDGSDGAGGRRTERTGLVVDEREIPWVRHLYSGSSTQTCKLRRAPCQTLSAPVSART